MEGVQTQLRYAQLRVQSLEQEMKSIKQELEQKVRSASMIETAALCLFARSRNEKTMN